MNAIVRWQPQLNQVYCMDALTLLGQMETGSVDAIITDMPYGTTQNSWDSVVDLVQWWQQVKRIVKPCSAVVTTSAQPFTSQLVMSNPEWFRYEWIWQKNRVTGHLNANKMPMRQHESILIFGNSMPNYYPIMKSVKPTRVGRSCDGTSTNYGEHSNLGKVVRSINHPRSILDIPCDSGITVTLLHRPDKPARHPTQKPVALMEYLIRTYTQPGDTVLDPFMGSGTTAVAARNLNRNFIGCDITPEYVAIAHDRLQRTDPYLATVMGNGMKQMSLFEGVS
jgi:site-specific DNA-methyltransferase (adenine-specific)